MSKGHSRRTADLENLEAEFAEALALARAEKDSAYVAEKEGRPRGAATALDVKLFTLESKIERLRQHLGLPAFAVPLKKPEPRPDPDARPWERAPQLDGSRYALDPAQLWHQLVESGRRPGSVLNRVRCQGAKGRQSPEAPTWRLATVECDDSRVPGRLTLTLLPLPEGPDAELAAQKLDDALTKLVTWCEKAVNTHPKERPRLLQVTYARAARELQLSAR